MGLSGSGRGEKERKASTQFIYGAQGKDDPGTELRQGFCVQGRI